MVTLNYPWYCEGCQLFLSWHFCCVLIVIGSSGCGKIAKKMGNIKGYWNQVKVFSAFFGGLCQASTGFLTLNVFLLSCVLRSGFWLVCIFYRLLFKGKYFRRHTLALCYFPLPSFSTFLIDTAVTYLSVFQACAFKICGDVNWLDIFVTFGP